MSRVWKNSTTFFGKFVRDLKEDDSTLEILPTSKSGIISSGITVTEPTQELCYLVSTDKGTELLCTGDTTLLDSRYRPVKVSELKSGILLVLQKDEEDFTKYHFTKEAVFEVTPLTDLQVHKMVSYESRFVAVGLSTEKFFVVSTD